MLGDSSVSGKVATSSTATATTTTTITSAAGRDEGGEATAAAAASAAAAVDGGSNSGEEDKNRANINVLDDGERGLGGNRWPRQETVTLLKIRSEMDVAFRDASVKGPLWEEVSRKLAELGYNRSAKKCKEKFENVYKYHKRTKDGRTSKGHGKAYRFFDQLEAFAHHITHSASQLPSPAPQPQPPQPPKPQPAAAVAATLAASMPVAHNIATTTVPSTTHITIPQTTISVPSLPATNPTNIPPVSVTDPVNYPNISADLLSNSTSSSTSSDLEFGGQRRKRKRKRKWRDFFEKLMKEVIGKQEELQNKFLEAIEKREHERMVREEAWRMQEMTRINREREILAQERSIAAAKDAAVMAFLQKLSEQQNPAVPGQVVLQNIAPAVPVPIPVTISQPPPALTPAQQPVSLPPPQPVQSAAPQPQQILNVAAAAEDTSKTDNGDQNNSSMLTSSSRWPKVEVQALIKLRTNLDSKYQENGPKGPLWEEISAGMRKLGYNRSSKRCKEKWENINKYFKKVKESKKKRSTDSKTCPYFEQLDALYKEKNKFDSSSSNQIKPENSVPLMVRPEQQWPPQPDQLRHEDSAMEDVDSDQNADEDDKDMGEDEEDGDGDGGGFEIVPNKQVSVSES